MGLVQGLAVFPGVSRSGATIAAGLGCGLQRQWVARFSFLLGVPAILGATTLEVISQREALVGHGAGFWLGCGLGTVAAALCGLLALRVVIRTVSSEIFHRFAWYCLPVGAVVMALGLWSLR
jgi:undecaprenyl-diphosphatase